VFTVAQRCITLYRFFMIKSFKHKELQRFFTVGSASGINPEHAPPLEERLQALHTTIKIDDMDLPGWRLHALEGNKSGFWAVNVSGTWRVVFEFKDGHAYLVNYENYQ